MIMRQATWFFGFLLIFFSQGCMDSRSFVVHPEEVNKKNDFEWQILKKPLDPENKPNNKKRPLSN